MLLGSCSCYADRVVVQRRSSSHKVGHAQSREDCWFSVMVPDSPAAQYSLSFSLYFNQNILCLSLATQWPVSHSPWPQFTGLCLGGSQSGRECVDDLRLITLECAPALLSPTIRPATSFSANSQIFSLVTIICRDKNCNSSKIFRERTPRKGYSDTSSDRSFIKVNELIYSVAIKWRLGR